MSFKKNTAVTGFPFGLVSSTDGSAITTGTPTVYYVLDGGAQGTVAGASTHEGNGQWSVPLTAAEMNGDTVGILCTVTGAIPAHFTIKTDTKIVSELQDIAATAIVSGGAINTTGGAVDTVTTNTDMAGTDNALLAADINLTGGAVDTVTTVTNQVTADVTAVSGVTAAADNLQLMYDGTGYVADTAPASRLQIDSIPSGGSAISTIATDAVVTTGTETLTYTATSNLDGLLHEVADVTNVTEFFYEFNVGGNGIPVEFIWDGYAQSNGDSYTVKAYNWVAADWDTIGVILATNATTIVSNSFQATNAHVGTDANIGLVRLQFASADGTHFATDRILCSYAVVSQSVGYANGAIWVDTNASNTNTADFVDGVADNPVSTWAAALTLSASLGLTSFHVAAGSDITLSANSDYFVINAFGAGVALGGQSVSGTRIIGATITGNDDGTNVFSTYYDACILGTSSLGKHVFSRCSLTANITLAEAADYLWDHCVSFVAGNGTPDVTYPAGVVALNVRHYSGGMEVNSMVAGQSMSFEGDGQFKIAATCTGGAVSIRGSVGPITDLAGGAVTLTENARIANDTINAEVDAALLEYDAPTKAELDSGFAGLNNVAATDIVSGGAINTTTGAVDTVTTNTDMRGTDNALLAASAPTNFTDLAIAITSGEVTVGTNNDKTGYTVSTVSDKTGYTISGTITTLDGLHNFDPTTDDVAVVTTNTDMLTAAAVNAEVVDAINVDTYAEPPQGTPGATVSLVAKISYIYKFLRNKKTATDTTISVFNDDAVTVDHKSTISENAGTYTETEYTTGP